MVINAAHLKHNKYDKAAEDVRGSFFPLHILSMFWFILSIFIKNIPAFKKESLNPSSESG